MNATETLQEKKEKCLTLSNQIAELIEELEQTSNEIINDPNNGLTFSQNSQMSNEVYKLVLTIKPTQEHFEKVVN